MRIAFLGTPEFAVPSLEMLYNDGHTLAVFTQPDRPQGRKQVLTPPPVKAYAIEKGIPVYQFERIKSEEGVEALKDFAPELMVTAAFGQILSQDNLDIPKYGCVNVHGSLLPKYRGAAPIQWSIIDGEEVTGVTTMLTDIGLDTGDMLLKDEIQILEDETAADLYERMAVLGANTLKKTIALLEKGEIVPQKQDHNIATKCPMLKKEHGKIDFRAMSAKAVHDRVRGTNPWPGAYALLPDGSPLKIWQTRLVGKVEGEVGICMGDDKKGLFVPCADGNAVEIIIMQAPGSKRMNAKDYMRGKPLDGVSLS